MDTIFFNGCIRTLDNSEKVAEAVGIENGRIVFVGTDKEAEAFSCKKRIDLKGRLMLPGFVDTHMHMLHYAFVERSVKLFDCTSVEEMLAAAKKRLEESKGQKLTWLYCRGWNEEHFDKPRYPHKDELDALSTEIPIIMVRVCGHVAVCNSCGLELLKKIPEFPEIEKEVDLDTGLLKENAVQFYSSVLEAPSQEEVEGYIRYSAKKLNECGFTGVQSDDLASLPGKNWRRIMASYKALDARGELSIRHYEQCLFERAEDAKAFIEEGYRTGQRGDHFTIGPMKLIQDGSLGARTAAMNEPYEDSPENTGIVTFSQDELDDLFAFFDRHQMQAAVHCIGDRAMDMVIEAAAKSPYRKDNKKAETTKLLEENYQLSIAMSEYKQVIFDILSPLTEQAEKELLADEPLKDQIMAMRKMSGTVQSIMNLYSRKHVMDGMRIDVKMAELKKELEAAKKLPAVTGYDEELKNYQSFLSSVESFMKDMQKARDKGAYSDADYNAMSDAYEYGLSVI